MPNLLAQKHFSPHLDNSADFLLAELGSGFRLHPFRDQDRRLATLIAKAAELTAALDQYQRQSPSRCQHLSELAAQSIVIQHGFLNLPAAVIDPANASFPPEEQYYEIARISALIYVGMVIFPNLAAALLRQHQAEVLQKQLLLFFQHECRQDLAQGSTGSHFDNLLLWSLALGAIAVFPSSDTRRWYVETLGTQVTARGLTWDEFNEEVHSFLFWDYVMLEPLKNLCFEETIFSRPIQTKLQDSGG